MNIIPIKACRICKSEKLDNLFSLGDLYISTFVKNIGENIGKAPLTLVWCENCTLVQLEHTAPQELMYSGHYWYKSGLNEVIKKDLREITEIARNMVSLKSGEIVLDIGANDGTLLSFYPKEVVKVGCEPATNLSEDMKKHADLPITDFWTYENYIRVAGTRKAKIITAIGMFYDMEDPNQFIRDARMVLDQNGIFIAQLMTSKPMLKSLDLGNICHEHIEYYSYESLKHLFEKNGLEIFKVEENSINGGSYRLFARHYTKGSVPYPEDITKESYLKFAEKIQNNAKECVKLIRELVKQGKKVYGYGASTKGNTILQYYGLNCNDIVGIAEIHEDKIGKYTVGTHVPIVKENEAKMKADYFLVLPYAFRDSFINREKEWLNKGGKFIFCTPQVEIYPSENNNLKNNKNPVVVMVSGGFDPLHIGHLFSFQSAKSLGDKLIVVVDGDDFLIDKKGQPFMPLEDRVAIIKELRCVDEVIVMGRGEIDDAILNIRPNIFAKGGDRNSLSTIPNSEREACEKVGCKIVFNVGGGKIRSSSELLQKWVEFKTKNY